jgi:hypothetical protein
VTCYCSTDIRNKGALSHSLLLLFTLSQHIPVRLRRVLTLDGLMDPISCYFRSVGIPLQTASDTWRDQYQDDPAGHRSSIFPGLLTFVL